MTAAPKLVHDNPTAAAVGKLMTREDLAAAIAKPKRYHDAEIEGFGPVRMRELRQREMELINAPLFKREVDLESGSQKVQQDTTGYRARCCAMALTNLDGTPFFPGVPGSGLPGDPLGEGVAMMGELPPEIVDGMFKAFDVVNVVTKEARAALGKSSKPTPSAAS